MKKTFYEWLDSLNPRRPVPDWASMDLTPCKGGCGDKVCKYVIMQMCDICFRAYVDRAVKPVIKFL